MNTPISNRPANSGDTKLSEVAVDNNLPLDASSTAQSNALTELTVAMQAIVEAVRKQNYVLRSNGNIFWTGTQIRFDDSAQANDIVFEVLGTEGSVNRSFTLTLPGSASANSNTTYEFLPLVDGNMLYLELNSSLLIDSGTNFVVTNAVNGGGSPTPGLRLLSTPIASGLPAINQSSTGGTIFNIPLAIARGTDIWWVPHGIRWPAGTVSTLGAIIIQGITPWPTNYVLNEAQLNQAITACAAAGGGIILINGAFSITTAKTIPQNTKLLGRGGGSPAGGSFQAINMVNGSTINMTNNFSSMEGVQLIADSTFTGTMLSIGGFGCTVRECNFDLVPCSNVSTNIAINFGGTGNRLYHNFIRGTSLTNKVGIKYVGGSDTTDVDTMFYT
jgi:hypothetical protein